MKLSIEITDKCPLNCIHCSSCADYNQKYFMTPERYRNYLTRNQEVVKISGGEPFEHPQISLFPEIAKSYGTKKVEILSSGNYKGHPIPKRFLEECKPYLDRIMFSIYGNATIHDLVTRTPGSRNNLGKTIESCIKMEIPFKFETIAMPGVNLPEIFKYLNRFKKRRLSYEPSLKVMHLVNQGRALNLKKFSEEEVEEFKNQVLELGKEYHFPTRFSCSLTGNCLAGEGKKAVIIIGGKEKVVDCSSMKHPTTKKFGCRH